MEKADLLKIMSRYRVKKQLKKLHEELYEFTETVLEYEYSKDGDLQNVHHHMSEEFADVMVLMMQFKLFFGIKDKDIEEFMDCKTMRQIQRMEQETET